VHPQLDDGLGADRARVDGRAVGRRHRRGDRAGLGVAANSAARGGEGRQVGGGARPVPRDHRRTDQDHRRADHREHR
jgi:hypothetical protein